MDDFCDGNVGLYYLYIVFLKHGMLESAQTKMPRSAQHSSEAGGSATQRPRRGNKSNAKTSVLSMSPGSRKALTAPIRFAPQARSAAEKEVKYHEARICALHMQADPIVAVGKKITTTSGNQLTTNFW